MSKGDFVDFLLLSSFIVSFLVTYFLTPFWIRATPYAGLVGKDMNKYEKPEVSEIGGIPLVAGFTGGVLVYISLSTFYIQQNSFLIFLLASLLTVLSMTVIGIVDDILRWKIGLKQWQKPLLTLPAALPVMAVNAGESTIILPFFGTFDFGIIYPLLIIPIGIAGAANGFNMLAGYNGLEAGLGAIILSTLGFVSWKTGNTWVAMLAFSMVFALLAFLIYNWNPARVFPGDTMTYAVGALIACIAIFGNMEKIAVILFIPYFMDFLLPLRASFKTEAFAKVNPDGSLEMPYEKDWRGIYDVTHLSLYILKKVKQRVYEKEVVLLILAFEIAIALLVLLTGF
jgi:UDP-N-acetylglucosamine--dolichyl-phosphate N-acetylglucosaminephosphotransferase